MPSLLLALLLICTCFISPLRCLPGSDQVSPRKDFFGQSGVVRQDLKTLGAHMNAEAVSTAWRKVANKELCVPIMQGIIDGLAFNKVNVNKTAIVNEMAAKLNETFDMYGSVLRNARDAVQIYYGQHPMDMQVFRPFKECCRLRNDELRHDVQFGSRVNLSFACDIVSPSEQPQFLFYPNKNLTLMYQHNAAVLPGLRWQYFISSAGSHLEYPAHSFDPLGPLTGASCVQREMVRHRAPYLSSALPYPKRVVILIDYGSAISDSQLLKIQAVGKTLLESFSGRDRVTVLAMSSKVTGPCGTEVPDLLDPTTDAKDALVAFIDSLNKTEERTNHSLGLEEAYKVLIHAENSLRRTTQETVHNFIMYVSRGLLTNLTEASAVLSTMAHLTVNTYISVQINTFAILDRDKTMLWWGGQFLRDVAEQNFQKYRHSLSQQLYTKLTDAKINPPKGKTVVVDDNEVRTVSLTKVFEALKTPEAVLEPSYRTLMSWSAPLNELGNPVVSATMPVWHKDDFIGVIGHDLNLNAIADALKYADLPDNSKARLMLTDLDGRVLVDSRLREGFVRPASVADLEGWSKSDRWKASFASEEVFEGSFELSIPVDANTSRRVSYTWQKLESAPFVVLLASEMRPQMSSLERRSIQTLSLRKVVYHRLDLQLNKDIHAHCTLMDQLSTIERGSVYLGPSCFTSPHAHMSSDKNSRDKQTTRASGYWVYLGDGAGLIRNTGVRPGVREDVGALAAIVDEWQQRFASSPYQKHILRRFVATNRGVMVTFPATVFTDDFDPTERHWYKRALQFPGRIVLTGPYLDSSAGDIVTISHTVYEGEGAAMHKTDDQVFAVMGMDVSIDFVFKILYDTLSVCRQYGRRCIMFEDTGYLVARGDPLLNQGNRTATTDMNANPLYAEREPMEGGHLTHREPSLAIHLLQNDQFMRKTTCKQFASQTHQRLYQFNTSYTDAIRMTGESPSGCTRSEVTPVPRTNAFLAVLDHTCDVQSSVQSAFCPCSVSDRRCLLCSRIDPLECECPCECPLNSNGGAQCSTEEIAQSPVCDTPEPPNVTPSSARDPNLFAKLASREGVQSDKHLAQCVPIRCEQHTTVDKCLGVLGCQWCLRAEDGRRLLTDPFCSAIDQCFGGIRGRSIQGYRYDDEVLSAISTPVGPVAGAIMGVFVLLVIAVYCYRHQVTRLVESRVSAGSGARLYPTTDDDDDEYRFDHEGSKVDNYEMGRAPISVMQLASFERNSIPRAQYRPGPRTESSDHGYSTMTDRMAGDESERGTTIDLGAAPLCKPRSGRGYRLNDKSDSGVKLLVDEEAESAIDSNNDDDNSASSAPTGQTSLNDSSFCESRLVITTADVHAVEAK